MWIARMIWNARDGARAAVDGCLNTGRAGHRAGRLQGRVDAAIARLMPLPRHDDSRLRGALPH